MNRQECEVRLQSDAEQPTGDPGRSLCAEVTKMKEEVQLLREQVAKLCDATRALCQLQSVLNVAVKTKLETPSADFGVI